MMMKQGFDVQALVDELEPVKPLDWRLGWIAPAVLTLLGIVVTVGILGLRPDLAGLNPQPMFLLRGGLLMLLGVVCGTTLISMASPGVGRQGNSWKIAVAAALLLPMAALMVFIAGQPFVLMAPHFSGFQCLRFSLLMAAATAIPMVHWLRRGAPVLPERAGWLTGLSSGGLGAFAYGFHCPYDDIVYIGFWYGLAVTLAAIAGRLIVPRLIRW